MKEAEMAIAILYSEDLKEYDFGPGHPFRGERYPTFFHFLKERLSEGNNYHTIEANLADDDDLFLICHKDYVDFTREFYKAANLGLDYQGNLYRFHSGDNIPYSQPGKLEEAARLIVGQAKKACDLVIGGEYEKAICIGGGLHHAKPSYGEGFCLYNDVAFCAKYLLQEHKLNRVLILDTDAHAGNGTAEYFYNESNVLLIDIHQDPSMIYPGTGFVYQTGEGLGEGYTINIPMPLYSGYDSYNLVFEEIVKPIVEEFRPEIIIRNGGSDPHFSDGLTNLGLSIEGFRLIGEKVREMANEVCQGRVIDLIASGYNKNILPYAWLALICGLGDISISIEEPEPIPERFLKDPALAETRTVINEVNNQFRKYWSSMK